jgi:hypothetical protein
VSASTSICNRCYLNRHGLDAAAFRVREGCLYAETFDREVKERAVRMVLERLLEAESIALAVVILVRRSESAGRRCAAG